MLTHSIDVRVRYVETDPMGYVHHSNYAVYLEMARTEFLRQTGVAYRDIEKRGLYIVVVRLTCDFKAPAQYDDILTIRTTLKRITYTRIDHEYEIYKDSGKTLVLRAQTVLACVDREGKIQQIPEEILALTDKG